MQSIHKAVFAVAGLGTRFLPATKASPKEVLGLLWREKLYAYCYQGTSYDCGSKLGYLQATVDLAEQHNEVGQEKWLQQRRELAA